MDSESCTLFTKVEVRGKGFCTSVKFVMSLGDMCREAGVCTEIGVGTLGGWKGMGMVGKGRPDIFTLVVSSSCLVGEK